MQDLFDLSGEKETLREPLAEGAMLLRGFAAERGAALLAAIEGIAVAAPFRRMITPGGFEMSVAMTNSGTAGWVTDRKGYRYARHDPDSGKPWPSLPAEFLELAEAAATEVGFPGFVPDACLINRYEPGARLSLHQDRDEADYGHPIVSVSLGLPATFQFGGLKRSDPVKKVALRHGDVVVWGGAARLFHHGVLTLKDGEHPLTGHRRFNLTMRKAL